MHALKLSNIDGVTHQAYQALKALNFGYNSKLMHSHEDSPPADLTLVFCFII
ncbi:hypothetical protein [Vibrio gallaecicus]|uniref:hypothetical protein n=1 Tax=Vibrio gallaecicus TaxID=552386 RepID=UPI0025B46C0D|nr:hypothetical protein [Vibrio gallaecicus]MDN3616275.1 hypothetical protein [Vibrio gallaecicus]